MACTKLTNWKFKKVRMAYESYKETETGEKYKISKRLITWIKKKKSLNTTKNGLNLKYSRNWET